ncbi:MAG: hypothetical protein M0Z66_15145 [Thermaerobacter sp.]|nr:hypothetical protein [Thermaerobacter sp.]
MAFSPATAEQVISVIEAVIAHSQTAPATDEFVTRFTNLPRRRAQKALELAADLGFLAKVAPSQYKAASPLCRFLSTPQQQVKATVLRILLELYEPYYLFCSRLLATQDATLAASQVKAWLRLSYHPDEVKDTLLSLGLYSQALVTRGAGEYDPGEPADNALAALAASVSNLVTAERRVTDQIGYDYARSVPRTSVILPLAHAFLKAVRSDGGGAVTDAGNALESYLQWLAVAHGVTITGATGINALLDKFKASTSGLPPKIDAIGRYLGHVRNGADHGTDPVIRHSWSIRPSTGLEYVFVCCSFISDTMAFFVRVYQL